MNDETGGDQTFLTFGSILAIADYQDQNAFIFSDGFLKTNIVLKSFVREKQKTYLKNNSFHHCLFQVLPRLSDTAKNSIMNTIKEKKKSHPPQELEYKTEQQEQYICTERYQMKDINEKLQFLLSEYKYNLDAVDKAKMGKLSYNQPFELMHVASGRFLGCHEVESRYENQNYQLKLDDFTSDATVFKIVPAFRYQKDGEQEVNAGEMCAITRAIPISNKPTYIHCSTLEISDMKNNKKNPEQIALIHKREVNASVEHSHSWKIAMFEQYIPEATRFLKVGDCLWLHHSEAESVLAVQKKMLAVDKYTFTSIDLTKWLDMDNSEVTVSSSVGSSNQDSYQGTTSGLWQVEGSDFTQGGYIQFEKGYRLRSLSSGFYLQVISHPDTKLKKNQYQFSLSGHSGDKSSLFEFIELKTLTQDKYVKSGSYVYLKNQQTNYWIDFNHQPESTIYRTSIKKERTEHAVFKILVPSKNAVWEINFLLSCFRMLAKFLIQIQKPPFPGINQFNEKQHFTQKFKSVTKCINELDDFVNNRQYNTSIEQIYGHINTQRQKLLKEQFYIDILVKILSQVISKGELELWQQYRNKNHEQDKNIQIIQYVGRKVQLCNQIYKFLGSVCKLNPDNQVYTFDLIPYFQLQTKYIPTAIDTIIEILQSNRSLLYRLSDGLKIDFDFQNPKEFIDDNRQKIKILINLYDDEKTMQFKQHEKITSKPINLISYFVNLIWDDEAHNNADYLRFLLSVCRYKDEAININQENIFKLYKRYNDVKPKLGVETKAEETKQTDGTVRLISKAGQIIIPPDCDEISGKKFRFIVEQLNFFSEVAYGRNYLWKKELGAQFEKSFLFRNIWNAKPESSFKQIKPCFAKIATTLYIDQDPLQQRSIPNFCVLYKECDQAEDFKFFKRTVDDSQNMQELNTYNDLVVSMLQYFKSVRHDIQVQIKSGQEKSVGDDILQDELIHNSTKLLYLLIKLDLFQVLHYSLDYGKREDKSQNLYSSLIEILLYLFQYDKFELQFVKAHISTFDESIKKKIALKQEKNLSSLLVVPNFFNLSKQEEVIEQNKGETTNLNEQALYINPIMRGYIKFANTLQSFNHMEKKHIQNELNVKINICNIYEKMLDLRQNFLMQNTLVFFKHQVVDGSHDENNEHIMNKRLRENNNYSSRYHLMSQDDKDQMIIERLLKIFQLLPNISRTGIEEVDDPKKEGGDSFGLLNLGKDPVRKFQNFMSEEIPEILDFDQYLSLQLKDPNIQDKPVASMLPALLNSFMQISDPELEKRCIGVIMRMFNQQEEFKKNLHNLQVIFDDEKTILYKYVTKNIKLLQRHVERIEIWFTNFQKGHTKVSTELQQCSNIIQNLNYGLYHDIKIKDDNIITDSRMIDEEKQNLLTNLKVYSTVINFIRDGMPYFHDMILEPDVPYKMKLEMIQTFSFAFQFLKNMCLNNSQIQLILYEEIQFFTNYLQYDLGQIPLLIEMFKNNKFLLVQKIDSHIIQIFCSLIEREGRQEQFLDFFELIMQYKSIYIFDNQIKVSNNLLTSIGDRGIKILYADGMKDQNLKFYLKDVVFPNKDDFLTKLEEVEFKDTFRDEPFRYHRRLLDILLQTTLIDAQKRQYQPFTFSYGAMNFNIGVGKIKKFFKAEYLIEILKENDNFLTDNFIKEDIKNTDEQVTKYQKKQGYSILKPQVLEFLRLIHISSERGSLQNSQLYNCQQQLKSLFDLEVERLNTLNYKEQVQDTNYVEYCMRGLIPFVISYWHRFVKSKQNETQQQDEDKKDGINNFVRTLFARIIKLPTIFIETQYDAQVIKELDQCFPHPQYQKIMKQSVDLSDDELQIAQRLERLEKGQSEEEYFIVEKNEVFIRIEDFPADEEDPFIIEDKPRKAKTPKKIKPVLHDDSYQSDIRRNKALWQRFLNELLGNKVFVEHQNKERETIANGIINIEKLLNPQFSKQVAIKPDIKMVSKKLILFLQSAFNDPQCKVTIDTLLKILKKIIEKEGSSKDEKFQMQLLFDKLGATQMVLLVLSENSYIDKKMLLNFLIFINCILSGGNAVVQQTIYNFFISFPQSEMIFQKFNAIFKKQIANIAGKQKIHLISMIDEIEVDQDQILVMQVLQFIQNSVEGHYLNLQDYLRQQTNSRTNYDLIITVTELLLTYYYKGCTQNNYDDMIKCLDTLNELVQGPCPENQIAVSESKFFEIAADIFSKKKEKNTDKNCLKKWMITRLQNKVLMLILSLLENREINESNQVLKRIMRNLPIGLLERHLAKSYKNYKTIYEDKYEKQCLEHLNEDPRKLEQKKLDSYHEKYFETVLQNGFLLYFLISYYIQCDPRIESPVVQLHRAYVKSVLKMDKRNITEILFSQSLPGQLMAFFKQLLDSLFGIMNSVNKIAQEQLFTKGELTVDQILKQKAEAYGVILKESVAFFLKNSAHIDVVYRDHLEIVYFILLPLTKHLPQEKKELFNEQVDRNTTQTKVQGLFSEADNLIEICKHEENLFLTFKKQKFLSFFTNYVKLWQESAFYLTIFLNTFILFSFDSTWGDRIMGYVFFNQTDKYTVLETDRLVTTIGIVMTCCSIFVVTYFLLKNAPIIFKRAWNQKGLFDLQTNLIFQLVNIFYKIVMVVLIFLQEVEVMYYIAYGIFAVLGTIIHPFFFVFHLSEILFRYPSLKNTILSVWKPRAQLVLTILLFVILIYFFTLVGYTYVYDSYLNQCDVLLYCLLINMDQTFKASIGTYLSNYSQVGNTAEQFGFGRFFYDNISNIVLGLIMLSIVAGIIIDTFGSLREEDHEKQEDIKSKCFICGNLKTTFDRYQSQNQGGFKQHIKLNHNMWDYLFFIAYLRWKNKQDYSGIESFVLSKLEEDDLCWVPFNQSRELQMADIDENQGDPQMIENMQQRLIKVQEQLKEMAKILKINYKK